MNGQGSITQAVANYLDKTGWKVIYTCIPNTPHLRVVPIPVVGGASRQRYPDIVSTDGNEIRLTEVEISLSESVAVDIFQRFKEMTTALKNETTWSLWSKKIVAVSGITLPKNFVPKLELILCKATGLASPAIMEKLRIIGVRVVSFDEFITPTYPEAN